MDQISSSTPTRRPTLRRRAAIVVSLVLALAAAPGLVLASHQFTDVPNSSPFHAQISNLVGSGITTGCGGTQFCPKSPVLREQMAAFFNRGLGYAAANEGTILASETFEFYVTDLTLPARSASGGTNYVQVTGDATVFDSAGYCPCGVILTIRNLDTGDFAPEQFFNVGSETVGGASANTGSVSWVFEVPSGQAQDFALDVIVFTDVVLTGANPSTDGVAIDAEVYGNLTALYVPFGTTVPYGGKPLALDAYQDQLDRLHAR